MIITSKSDANTSGCLPASVRPRRGIAGLACRWLPVPPGAASPTLTTSPTMPDTANAEDHVKPFVYETLTTKALHFSISEIQSRMQSRRPLALDLDYTRTMMGFLLFNDRPDTIGMIGLGGGSLAKFCRAYLPKARIDVVEINPHVIALRDVFHVPPDDHLFAVRRGDGADFVRSPPHRLDVLMVDGYDPDGIPPALCSQALRRLPRLTAAGRPAGREPAHGALRLRPARRAHQPRLRRPRPRAARPGLRQQHHLRLRRPPAAARPDVAASPPPPLRCRRLGRAGAQPRRGSG